MPLSIILKLERLELKYLYRIRNNMIKTSSSQELLILEMESDLKEFNIYLNYLEN